MTLPVDLRFRGIGRIHVRSGTTKRPVRDAMKQMLRTLYQMGRADLLRDIQASRVSVMEVYERFRGGRLDQLPSGALLRSLEEAWDVWLAGKQIKGKTRVDYQLALTRIVAFGGAPTVRDLPTLLHAHRLSSLTDRPRTFNKDRSAALSFLATTLGDAHWLYAEVKRLEVLDVVAMPINPQTVEQARALASKLPAHHARTFWGLALTGMRPEEFFQEDGNRWELLHDRVRVVGTKTKASIRDVPRIGLIVRSETGRRGFSLALKKASGGRVTPIDLRRSYAQWLDLARIPNFRQDYYMAHGSRDLNQLYKRMRECLPYLVEDREALLRLVSEPADLRIVR